ncbi:hypothetical protein [Lysinibacillus sphaericus]|uniref:Uncharacterized protein n=2 Tax=Lysinibacillus sphaericus TaxID=1421 RepID=R7ZDW8_LYSSH|nr:hypothetical protein [Lysinibacillus sphaericus]EON72196.1 hypothetical protein H131_11483 [Lysinibacillus sphaericus OT4b.31]
MCKYTDFISLKTYVIGTLVSYSLDGSPAMKTEVENFIAKAVKDEIILESHLKDLQNGVMTSD